MRWARLNKPAPLECSDTFWRQPAAAQFLISCKFTEQATLPADLETTVCPSLRSYLLPTMPRPAFIVHPPLIVHCTTPLTD